MAEYFTRTEAESLLPRLELTLREMQALRAELAECERQLNEAHARMASNGHVPLDELTTLPMQVAELTERLTQSARELAESGAILKDLDMGLLDFPTMRDGHEVYLCWRLGEDRISWWHEIDSGLAGRRPLEDDA